MKFLIKWKNKPKYLKETRKLLEKFEQPKEMKMLFAAHYYVGDSTRGVMAVDVEDTAIIHKAFQMFEDYVKFKVTPILPLFGEE